MYKPIACVPIFLLLSSIVVTGLLAADVPNSKERKIRELLKLTGSGELGKQVVTEMLDSFRAMPGMSNEFIARFQKEVSPSEFDDLIVPIYDKYLSEEDLDELIAFYKTPVGKKLISVLPKIMKDSMEVGQKWGAEKAMKVMMLIDQENDQ